MGALQRPELRSSSDLWPRLRWFLSAYLSGALVVLLVTGVAGDAAWFWPIQARMALVAILVWVLGDVIRLVRVIERRVNLSDEASGSKSPLAR